MFEVAKGNDECVCVWGGVDVGEGMLFVWVKKVGREI